MKANTIGALTLAAFAAGAFALPTMAGESNEELARKTNNPVAELISVALQLDYDRNIGPVEQGDQYQLTIKPVVPISIRQDWKLKSRSLVPVISQQNVRPGAGTDAGLGDVTQQFYFSPKAPSAEG